MTHARGRVAMRLVGALASMAAVAVQGCARVYHQGPPSDHFDGVRFFDPQGDPADARGLSDVLKWQRSRSSTPWPADVPVQPTKPRRERVGRGALSMTFINHATVLVQIDGKNVLTDPVWSSHASPVQGMGPGRHRAPGVRFADLPPVDVVLISHNHYDHMDVATLARLAAEHDPVFVVGLGNATLLRRVGIERVVELDWEQQAVVAGLAVRFVYAKHWSSRSLWDRNKALWGAFDVRAAGRSVYFAGDTGFSEHFARHRARHGTPEVALLPIGAYEPRWFMRPQHMDPDEAVRAHLALGASFSVGIHFGTFQLTDEGIDAPIDDLRVARDKHGVAAGAFVAPGQGERFELDRR
jgi:L-ascorbate metabolism protein UlaG (beta-lactamase superfamily)